jgi:hypothetical protein
LRKIARCPWSGDLAAVVLILQKAGIQHHDARRHLGHGRKAALFATRDFS